MFGSAGIEWDLTTASPAEAELRAPVRLPGLDLDRTYRVRTVGPAPLQVQAAPPPWFARGEVTLPGRLLVEVGVAAPLLAPENAVLLAVEAVATHGSTGAAPAVPAATFGA
jgi:alpha-galactosidase